MPNSKAMVITGMNTRAWCWNSLDIRPSAISAMATG